MTVYYSGTMVPASRIITETQDYRTDLLPGFVLPLGHLLAQADHWKPKRKPRPRPQPADAPPEPETTNPPAGGTETDG